MVGRYGWIINKKSLWRLPVYLGLAGLVGGCMMNMPGKSYRGALPPMTRDERRAEQTLRRQVTRLAGTIGERNIYHPEKLSAAVAFLRAELEQAGYTAVPQEYEVEGVTCANLVVELRGSEKPDRIIVVGGHYDAVRGCPAANDNGSGAAATVWMAARLKDFNPRHTLRFVLFVNEEPPFFQTDTMGSMVYAKACRSKGEQIVGMISLETIGYYSDEPGSQQYPWPLNWFYPGRGNFIAFVGNPSSRKLLRESIRHFRKGTPFPSEGACLPASVPGVGWSDQWAFWQQGYPGIMVTDTAPFRYPYYHSPGDTPDKLDYARMARVVMGMVRVVEALDAGDAW